MNIPHHALRQLRPSRLAAAVAACLALAGAHAATMSKEDADAHKQRIESEYKADKTACDSRSGNAKDICLEEAKGKEKVARADLAYQQSGKAGDAEKLAKAKADAAYDVAKEKCDDLSGNPKDVCLKEAKAEQVKATANAKQHAEMNKARSEATSDKNDAAYKAEVEKCDAMAGAAKDSCVASAKQRFGKG